MQSTDILAGPRATNSRNSFNVSGMRKAMHICIFSILTSISSAQTIDELLRKLDPDFKPSITEPNPANPRDSLKAPGEPSVDISRHDVLAQAIGAAYKVTIFEGLPRFLPKKESGAMKTINIKGFQFYDRKIKPDPVDGRFLVKVASSGDSFSKFIDGKGCGGFHADFAIVYVVYQTKIQEIRCLVCFGCHEAKFYGANSDLHCEINIQALKTFKRILGKYQNQRPSRQPGARQSLHEYRD